MGGRVGRREPSTQVTEGSVAAEEFPELGLQTRSGEVSGVSPDPTLRTGAL